ncbi:hypothetical protein BW723_12985 [Polaribacter reichenbachii]|uniref:AB hydrolase-1 domain-containing protein n=1 Tax=Polaribacter reichenbachii TaxID=996801 RepID=A0A1B8TZY6_9FLAO|nr:alpha/beta hydrolase [Polaribacter reichenbachii]APZ47142.1 hypothetical protein BW723_12985 [Polaribacter reichenbachii]AUC17782.1 hypothetical protein BTO17_03430 [Polaribacter reichenbachii]OBY65194.1 hypothetical protein LPB301_08795 [Polaribacter reichenbachii]
MIHLQEWESKHKSILILNEKLSFIDTESEKEVLIIFHEFGASSFNYYKIINELKQHYRVIIPDLIGFGLSSKPQNYYNSILDHAQILIEFINLLNINRFSTLSHGFGTSVLSEFLNIIKTNALNIKVKEIFLLNGSLTIETTNHKSFEDIIDNELTNKFIKITISYELFKKYYRESLGKKDAITEDEFKVLWQLQNRNNGGRIIKFIDYSIKERKLYCEKWIEILKLYQNQIQIIWGKDDVLSNLSSVEKLKNILNITEVYTLEDCGHFPMMEKPKQLSKLILHLKN